MAVRPIVSQSLKIKINTLVYFVLFSRFLDRLLNLILEEKESYVTKHGLSMSMPSAGTF